MPLSDSIITLFDRFSPQQATKIKQSTNTN
jgi:hypothetical protein